MRTTRLTDFGFALFCLFLSSSIAAGQPPAQNQSTQFKQIYCVSAWDQPKIYFSDVFETNMPRNFPGMDARNVVGEIAKLFEAKLKQKFGYTSSPSAPVVCAGLLNSVASAEEERKQLQAKYTGMDKQVVETGWKLSPQQRATLPTPECVDPTTGRPCAGVPTAPTAAPATSPTRTPPAASGQANPSGPPDDRYVLCFATLGGYASRLTGPQYYSAPFSGATGTHSDWMSAFAKYLHEKYNYKGVASCLRPATMDAAQALLKKWVDDARKIPTMKYLETGWVYTPGYNRPQAPAAATPAAAPAPAPAVPPQANPAARPKARTQPVPTGPVAPKVTHAVCYVDFAHERTWYYSAVFDGTSGDYDVWMPAFQKFLEQKYKFTGMVRCNKHPSRADAQKYWDEMLKTARTLTLAGGVKRRIIETGWAYK